MKGLSALLVLIAFSNALSAQTSPLQFRTFSIAPEPAQWNSLEQPISGEVWNGYIYRIVQFAQIPDVASHERIRNTGIELIDYVPQNAYLAAIPFNYSLIKLQELGVIAVLPMNTAMKLAPAASELPVPDYAIDQWGHIKVQVAFHRNVDGADAIENLQNQGYVLWDFSTEANLAVVSLPFAEIPNLTESPFIRFIDLVEAPGEPENYTAAHMHRSTAISSLSPGGLKYDGRGVQVQLQDDGGIGPHIDYEGRIGAQFSTNFNVSNDHGDHIAGTIMGAGNLNPHNRGMATGAKIYVYNYASRNDSIRTHYHQYGLRITNSSYSNGCNAGYTTVTRKHDEEAELLPELIHVFSAGNSNGTNCNYGAGSQWGNITGGHKMGKNVIATANLTINDVVSNSSSRGPAHDGRIKPDIAAKGSAVVSTIPNNNYSSKSGTSMAAPGIAGTLAQLYHAYKDINQGVTPESDIMKALILNTADDLGNPGPDFIYGWGRVNALRAYKVLEAGQIIIDSLVQQNIKQIPLQIPVGTKEARLMIYWHDKPALENANPALVNDLDMLVMFGQKVFHPWVLNHFPHVDSLSMPAGLGRDSLNNVEQVVITDPEPGLYTLLVHGKRVPFGTQRFVVVYEWIGTDITITHPAGGEAFTMGSSETVYWNAHPDTSAFIIQISTDSGQTWLQAGTAPGNGSKQDIALPNVPTGMAMLRIIRNNDTTASNEAFSIMGRPDSLRVVESCCDNVLLTWDTVAQATGYVIYTLGSEYMEPRDTISSNEYRLYSVTPDSSVWVSVRTLGPNGAWSERTISIEVLGGQSPCSIAGNLTLEAILEPGSGMLPACLRASVVTVKVHNSTADTLYNVPVGFKYANDTIQELIDTLWPVSSTVYTFQNTFTPTIGFIENIEAWVSSASDGNNCDDTITVPVLASATSIIHQVPYLETLQSFSRCPTTSNCGNTICQLSNGWSNEENGIFDDHDWRIHRGSTPSQNTGPVMDIRPGTGLGHYMYLEATTCFNNRASLLSPCIDLSGTVAPKLRFWYHMFGVATGSLQVDIRNKNGWSPAVFYLEGDQGNQWIAAVIDLTPYAGDTISVRFIGVTGPSFTSDIALDNFYFFDDVPVNIQLAAPEFICLGESALVELSISDLDVDVTWNFDDGSSPASGTGAGPFLVNFSSTGLKTVTVIIEGFNWIDTVQKTIQVKLPAIADLEASSVDSLKVLFESQSTNTDSLRWYFGDGNTDTFILGEHTFATRGIYHVMLVAYSSCGNDTLIETINLYPDGILVANHGSIKAIVIPNPNKGVFNLLIEGTQKMADMQIVDLTGRTVWFNTGIDVSVSRSMEIDLSGHAPGVYLVRIYTGSSTSAIPFVISR